MRRSQSAVRRGDRPRKTYEPAGRRRRKASRWKGHRRRDDDKSNAAFNYGPISAPSSRCAPLERILLKRDARFSRVPRLLSSMRRRIIVSRICFARVPRLSPARRSSAPRRCAGPARLVVKKLSRAERVRQKHANFSFTIINSRSARSSHYSEPCSPRSSDLRVARRSSVMDRAVRAIFSCTSATAPDVYQSEFMPLPY